MTEAIRVVLAERLARTRRAEEGERRRGIEAMMAIQARAAHLPVLDPRSADEILGYDADGSPR